MADLNDRPISAPVASETIVIKPDQQTNITESQGNKNVDFFFPDYCQYMLPSQSYLSCNVEMRGRGNPIPSPAAAFHSFINTVRSYDGTNSNLLSECLHYNTMVAQQYTYTTTDAATNTRLNYEGLQPTDAYDNNLYWGLNGASTWASTAAGSPTLAATTNIVSTTQNAKQAQINTTLKTFLLNTDKFVPLNIMSGMRTAIQIEDMRRALEYTTGKLGVADGTQLNGVCPQHETLCANGVAQFDLVHDVSGLGYTTNTVYPVFDDASNCRGFVNCGTVDPSGRVIADNLRWECTSTTETLPPDYHTGTLTLGAVVHGGAIATAANIRVKRDFNLYGTLAMGSVNAPYYIDVGCYTPGANEMSGGLLHAYGNGTLSNPFRCLNPIPDARAGIEQNAQFPNNQNPFSIGDRLYINKALNITEANEQSLGIISGFSRSSKTLKNGDGGQFGLRVYFQPNITAVAQGLPSADPTNAEAGNGVPVGNVTTNGAGFPNTYAPTGDGYQIYVKNSERVNGIPSNANSSNAIPTKFCDNFVSARDSKVGFTISDLQYQVKKVMLDPKVIEADMAAANGQGYTFDVEETYAQLTNIQDTIGPTNQLIANPNITRALGVISVPLDQNNQYLVCGKSLNGSATNMSTYQYDMGTDGRQPIRSVPVEKASLENPLIQTQHICELIKANESFGFFTTNLSKVGLNFAVGRAFSRPNMFYDLMKAGSLMLLANYETAKSGQKLFVHFIHHLRSITFSRMGVSIAN